MNMINQQELTQLINARLESGSVELPVFDDIALRIDREVRENKLDADLMCEILEEDLALVAELLRMANSSFFSGMSPVGSLREAAVRLGVRQIASIVFSVSQKRLYSASGGCFKSRLTLLWKHTSAVSVGVRWVAANAGYRSLADDAFVAGLLHDIGKLWLLCIIEDVITKDSVEISDEVIDQTLQDLHCEQGAMLLDSWNLPESFQNIVLYQDNEVLDPHNPILCMVRLVNKVCIAEGLGEMGFCVEADIESLPEVSALSLSTTDIEELRSVIRECGDERKAAA